MKEHGSKLPAEQPGKVLKSLLKKPGQSKSKSQKNRVVINEKLNEFFAADYIILIKEVCCADYEEDCDCCCQEYELIRLGNCKECRAELNLRFGVSEKGPYEGAEKVDDLISERSAAEKNCDDFVELHLTQSEQLQNHMHDEHHGDESIDDIAAGSLEGPCNECSACDDSVIDDGNHEQSPSDGRDFSHPPSAMAQKHKSAVGRCCIRGNDPTISSKLEVNPPSAADPREEIEECITSKDDILASTEAGLTTSTPLLSGCEHQHETLSPPDGYKDVCSNQTRQLENSANPPFAPCDYFHHPRLLPPGGNAQAPASHQEGDELDCAWEKAQRRNGSNVATGEEFHQEVPHRYLVETITMTTVTERRIVREISEEEGPLALQRDISLSDKHRDPPVGKASDDDMDLSGSTDSTDTVKNEGIQKKENLQSESIKELSLVFKLGNSSLMSNSLKPNSAVRQLFPNPKFISPPPTNHSGKADEESLGNRSFALNSTGNTKYNDSIEEELDSEQEESSSLIRKTIERNTLRRSLVEKYRAASRKKALQPRNLSLEERIRQLTCVDQDEESQAEQKYANQSQDINSDCDLGDVSMASMIRTSPSGEEQMMDLSHSMPLTTMMSTGSVLTPTTAVYVDAMSNLGTETINAMPDNSMGRLTANGPPISSADRICSGAVNIPPPNSITTSASPIEMDKAINFHKQNISVVTFNAETQTQNQSTYKKLADLFVHKKSTVSNTADLTSNQAPASDSELGLPDLGLGFPIGSIQNSKNSPFAKECHAKLPVSKANSDVRRQFLASLAPLSCMAVKGADNQEDYYTRHNEHSKMMMGLNQRDSTGYNSESSYSIEDIEVALAVEENRRYLSPPDVTRGTPTTVRPDIADKTTDELLAFVEQDKSRIERIRRRYEFDDNYSNAQTGCMRESSCKKNASKNQNERIVEGIHNINDNNSNNGKETSGSDIDNSYHLEGINYRRSSGQQDYCEKDDKQEKNLDDDDELNDYGFNRRPSVRGIKQQHGNSAGEHTCSMMIPTRSNSEKSFIVRRIDTRPRPASACFFDKSSSEIYEESSIATYDEIAVSSAQNLATDSYGNTVLTDERDANTINRINTMQKQIDDIYQTIAESAITAQQPLEPPEVYMETTVHPRIYSGPKLLTTVNNAPSMPEQYPEQQRNVRQYFQEQIMQNDRIVRAVNVCTDELNGGPYGNDNFPAKPQRPDPISSVSSYPIETLTATLGNSGRCYRTMYFVPYNGVSDPTYQNVQRGFPQNCSTNYGNHVERFPYHRLNKAEQHYRQQQQQQQQQQQPQQQQQYQHQHPPPLQPRVPTTQVASASLLQPALQPRSQSLPQSQHPPRYYATNHGTSSVPNQPPSSGPVLLPAGPGGQLNVVPSANPLPVQQTVHLHLHHNQTPENIHISHSAFPTIPYSSDQALQLHGYQQHQHQHHRHQHQARPYQLQPPSMISTSAPTSENTSPYTVIASTRCVPYAGSGSAANQGTYHVHLSNKIAAPASNALSREPTSAIPSSSAPECPALPFDLGLPGSSSSCSSSSSSASSASSASSSSFCSLTTSSSSSSASSSSIVCSSSVCPTSSILSVSATDVTPARRSSAVLMPGEICESACARTEYTGNSDGNGNGLCDDNQCGLSNVGGVSAAGTMQSSGSPTKLFHGQKLDCYAVPERGVPEGAASAPSHDRTSMQSFAPNSDPSLSMEQHTIGTRNPAGNALSPHAQSPIYYAMNV